MIDGRESPLHGFARYAVYWAPEAGSPLARFGAAWFGHDPEGGAPPAPPQVEGLSASREALVERPRRYGLHATLKPPFRLAPGRTPEALDDALAELADSRPPVVAPGLDFSTQHGFVSLRCGGPATELDALAATCVTALDGFRAPQTEEERAARDTGLDERAREHLAHWGYPYLFDRHVFHVTLTGALSPADAAACAAALRPHVAPRLDGWFRATELCLFGDPGGGRPFRLLRRHRLRG